MIYAKTFYFWLRICWILIIIFMFVANGCRFNRRFLLSFLFHGQNQIQLTISIDIYKGETITLSFIHLSQLPAYWSKAPSDYLQFSSGSVQFGQITCLSQKPKITDKTIIQAQNHYSETDFSKNTNVFQMQESLYNFIISHYKVSKCMKHFKICNLLH